MVKKVIIVGGGFAGLSAGKKLANQKNIEVILMDQRNYHLFQPLLYQVATAGLNPSDIAVPIRAEFSDAANIKVHMSKVQKVDLQNQIIFFGNEKLSFDYLILACGAQHSYFGHPEWEEFAPGLKTLEQATEIRRRILLAFEQAENTDDPEQQKKLLTFIVVGGGPTGVELAGAIAEISQTILVKDFKKIHPESARIILIEANPQILSMFAKDLSEKALQDIRKLGVEVKLSTRVQNINADGVQIPNEFIASKSVFWAAGVQATKINYSTQLATDRNGRIKVEKDFSIPNFKNIFVVGDLASFDLSDSHILPGLAPVAIQSGRHAAATILNSIQQRPRKDFIFFDKGQMATIGKNKAIAEAGKIHLRGRIAWFAWLFIHIFYLVGFKNRISVMALWVWSYVFSKRGARLITDKDWKLN